MGMPWILANEHRHFAMVEIAVDAASHHASLHPAFAGLFLRQGVGSVLHAQRRERAFGVGSAQMVALAGTAVVEDAFAAVFGLDGEELLSDFTDGAVPVDVLVGSVGAAAFREVDPVGSILVVVEALGFFAEVALGNRAGFVAADVGDVVVFDLGFEGAVERADDAGGFVPGGGGHRVPLFCWRRVIR